MTNVTDSDHPHWPRDYNPNGTDYPDDVARVSFAHLCRREPWNALNPLLPVFRSSRMARMLVFDGICRQRLRGFNVRIISMLQTCIEQGLLLFPQEVYLFSVIRALMFDCGAIPLCLSGFVQLSNLHQLLLSWLPFYSSELIARADEVSSGLGRLVGFSLFAQMLLSMPGSSLPCATDRRAGT